METGTIPEMRYCSECGRPTAPDELAHFGERLICGSCKDTFAQKLREGVAPAAAVTFAGFWIRVGAYLIDAVILMVAQGAVQMAFFPRLLRPEMQVQPSSTPEEALAAFGSTLGVFAMSILASMVVWLLYEGFFVARFAATPGKMALGLKVVRPNGGPVGVGRAFCRYPAKIVSSIPLLIGFIMVAFDSEKRGLHDMICDTRVVRTRT
ncbi:MAG: RDD family protein [Bryobacteraceae bacterium]